MRNTETRIAAKNIEGFNVNLVYKYKGAYYSGDPKAGKITNSKETVVIINGDEMCSTSGWVDHLRAFEDARICMKGTKWEF